MSDTEILEYKGLRLDEFQRQAIEAVARDEDVLVAAPTGAGKTLIAEYAIERALREGKRIVYTSPIKALSNQKYRDFTQQYPGQVGITTGDVSIRPDAPALIMTTEIFRNTIFESPQRLSDISYVIFDEVHFMDDRERGTVWEESIIFAPESIRILALSATVSNLEELTAWISASRGREMKVIIERKRPVPLEVFLAHTEEGIIPCTKKALKAIHKPRRKGPRPRVPSIAERFRKNHRKLVKEIKARGELPCLFFLFSRGGCENLAESFLSEDFFAEKQDGADAVAAFDDLAEIYRLDPADLKVDLLRRLIARGISFHHAGLLPVLKEIIERLFSAGHVRLLFATETFALGVNMPARSVAFEGLTKFDGHGRVPLTTRQFLQMAGRAGRRGLDDRGAVYLTFDPLFDRPHVAEAITHGEVEPVRSQFNLSYATLLNLYRHLGSRIFQACERSFANFRDGRSPKTARRPKTKQRHRAFRRGANKRDQGRGKRENGRGENDRGYRGMIRQVEAKLDLLEELGYLDREADNALDRLSAQGQFATQIYGSELQATELLFEGVLDHLSPEKLAVVFTALVYESRSDDRDAALNPRKILGKTVNRVNAIVGGIHELERRYRVRDPSRTVDWNLSEAVWAWVHGEDFDVLRDLTAASDGDIVRTLRQAIQLMRMVSFPLIRGRDRHGPQWLKVGQRMGVAIDLLRRDLVDAEWQLRVEEMEEAESEDESGVEEDSEAEGSSESRGQDFDQDMMPAFGEAG